jgi:hypothetical protein
MVAHMGFASVLARAGALGPPADVSGDGGGAAGDGDGNRTVLTAVSSNSGGTWFSAQLFYSDEFYRLVADPDPLRSLKPLVLDWMEAYAALQEGADPSKADPEDGGTGTGVAKLTQLASDLLESAGIDASLVETLVRYEGSMGDFILDMLREASTKAYDDPGFTRRTAGHDNRIRPLSHVDLLVQIAISPAAVSQEEDDADPSRSSSAATARKTLTSVGPHDTSETGRVFAVPLSLAHVVSSNGTHYSIGAPPGSLPLASRTSAAPSRFDFDNWQAYVPYRFGEDPAPHASAYARMQPPTTASAENVRPLNPLFGGTTPTVVQVAAASSDFLGSMASSNPSMMAQVLASSLSSSRTFASPLLSAVGEGTADRASAELRGDLVYRWLSDLTRNAALCSQWPMDCGEGDARLVDGGFVDNGAVVINVAAYQASEDADLAKTIKLFVTEADVSADIDPSSGDSLMLSYFSSPLNAGIAPGDAFWPVIKASTGEAQFATPTPILSLQIFQEFLDAEELESLRVPVAGTNLTTAVLRATTLDNPAYGVRAGQTVEIFYVEIHSSIPTVLVGADTARLWAPALADLAMDISSVASEALIERIHAFLAER